MDGAAEILCINPKTFESTGAYRYDRSAVESYIIADDETGRKFAGLLLQKRAECVRIPQHFNPMTLHSKKAD